jgi:sugar lactone lactonase YvrE
MPDAPLHVLLDDLVFPECPRWHDGRLWFSDMYDQRVLAVTEDGNAELIVEVPNQPAGLGWLPDGTMLIVSMKDRRLMRLDRDGLSEVADLTTLAPFHCNDMVVDERGRAYVGNFGFDLDAGAEPTGTTLVCVEPDGEAWVVVEQLLFPNGCVVTPDGHTLVVAESFGQRLSAFDIDADDGSLSNPRIWADIRPNVPDGICIDAEGAVWIADPVNRGVLRVVEGKGAVDWVSTGERRAYACALGGADGHTLFVCTADSSNPPKAIERRAGRIEATTVDVPYVGYVAPDSDEDAESEAA